MERSRDKQPAKVNSDSIVRQGKKLFLLHPNKMQMSSDKNEDEEMVMNTVDKQRSHNGEVPLLLFVRDGMGRG
ncbi:unnamed protein product [Victoria cruziana]